MDSLKISLVCTVFNEAKTITQFLESIDNQSRLPDEVVIVDGGSEDETFSKILEFGSKEKRKLNLKVFVKKGNRSVGRNFAIEKAENDIILSSDSGCILEKNWVKEIIKPFNDKKIDVVAGYYKGISKNIFQKSLIPYVLVMEDRIDEKEFLPATRSMAFRKTVWKKIGGFDKELSHNEDYAFANKIKKADFKITFTKRAIVYWLPRKNLVQSFKMFFRFALGDVQSKIFRPKVTFIFLRYILIVYLSVLCFIEKSLPLYIFLLLGFLLYLGWSIWKNYKYVKSSKAVIYLPLLQLTSDIAILLGSILGLLQMLSFNALYRLILNNKGISIIILLYIGVLLSMISYGIPGPSHPFDYFMDEWHQSQSVRDLFRYGTPNMSGAANGSIFQFFLSGLYLVPFYLLHLVNPFVIKSSVLNLEMQSRLFEILRLNTLIFGVGSIILIAYIAKKYYKVLPLLAVFLFTVNPIWLMLSNYFKYDIALIFWSLLSFLFFARYTIKPNLMDFLMAGIFTGLALSTKLLSPLPLFIVYILIFFLFTPDFRNKIKTLIMGVAGTIVVYALFGNPDIILGKGSLYEYVYANLFQTPVFNSANFIFGMDYKWYFITRLYPTIFGHVLYGLFLISLFYGLVIIIKSILRKRSIFSYAKTVLQKNKLGILVFLTFIVFVISLYPIKVEATNNRVLVLLPFIVIIASLFISAILRLAKNNFLKKILIAFIIILFGIQLAESCSWLAIKLSVDPRKTSSEWIIKNLPKGTLIGIENIPVYQQLPDVVLREFYSQQYKVAIDSNFRYQVISSKSISFPKVIVITNDDFNDHYLRNSDKKNLVSKLRNEGYKTVVQFQPNFNYFKLFNDELEYFVSGLVQAPNTVSIYEKQK
jgi:glycosyltransferase involved in cell wall biosynthesis